MATMFNLPITELSNGDSMDSTTIWSELLCEVSLKIFFNVFQKDAMLVKFFLNRALKVVGMIFCLISSPLLISAIWKFILPGVFHKNLKVTE